MNTKEIFSRRLRELREGMGLSQSELAKNIGLSRGSVSFYENGDRTPDIETLALISKFFNVSYDYLLGTSDCVSVQSRKGLPNEYKMLFSALDSMSRERRESLIIEMDYLSHLEELWAGGTIVSPIIEILHDLNTIGAAFEATFLAIHLRYKTDMLDDDIVEFYNLLKRATLDLPLLDLVKKENIMTAIILSLKDFDQATLPIRKRIDVSIDSMVSSLKNIVVASIESHQRAEGEKLKNDKK